MSSFKPYGIARWPLFREQINEAIANRSSTEGVYTPIGALILCAQNKGLRYDPLDSLPYAHCFRTLYPPHHIVCGAHARAEAGVAILDADTDRRIGAIDRNIYGHFLEHINHSVEDGLFAEQVRGGGFEGTDYATYWTAIGAPGGVTLVDVPFEKGMKSVRITAAGTPVGLRQQRFYFESGRDYSGSLWVNIEKGTPRLSIRVTAADGSVLATLPITARGTGWQEVPFVFDSRTDTQGVIEITATGNGSSLVDFVSLARADVRRNGMLRPDLLQALRDLAPPFIRWPGGSFAST